MRGVDPHATYLAIERFLNSSRQPVLIEPGEDPLPLKRGYYALTERSSFVSVECWDETRNLVRRVTGVKLERPGRLELDIEHFVGRSGRLTMVDFDSARHREAALRGTRLKFRERFRQSLHRQFPDWRISELSTEPDLHHSLSPVYPRALLTKGRTAMAAIGAAEDALAPDGVLSFGLIWLDYLRKREPKFSVEGLAVFLPAGQENTTCHRVRHLDPRAANYQVFVHDASGWEERVYPEDYTNFDTRLEPCRQPLAQAAPVLIERVERLSALEGIERRNRPDGSVSLAVNGIEFVHADANTLRFGLDQKVTAEAEHHFLEIESLASGLLEMRSAEADPRAPLFTKRSEAWLESRVRANIEAIDATLRRSPVYGQVPQFAAGDRSIIDLLAVDHTGRLAVIEIKASEDIHLPLQALDYWMRVKWHLERGEFGGRGYFPGIPLRQEDPRLLLVAPALEWHPSNDAVLRFFHPGVPVERLGVGIEWRRDLKIVFRK